MNKLPRLQPFFVWFQLIFTLIFELKIGMQHHMLDQPIATCAAMHFLVSHRTDFPVRCVNVKCINDVRQKLFQTVNGQRWLRLEKILLRMTMGYVNLVWYCRL